MSARHHSQGRLHHWFTALLLTLLACTARAENFPVIKEITFEGNDITKPVTMLRETVIGVGDAADPDALEESRQGIMDLGLFREVKVRQEPVTGGVRVVFSVHEKWYILPYPRLSMNSDGQYGYGAELRWSNLFGLNHQLRLLGSVNNDKKEGHGDSLRALASYDAPFLFDENWGWHAALSHSSTPITPPFGGEAWDEGITSAELTASRSLSEFGPASQGWSVGGGVLWQNETTSGVNAPDPYGMATAAVAMAGYNNQHLKNYSEEGSRFGLRYEFADRHFASDYSYSNLTANYLYQMPVGSHAHETLEFGAEVGSRNNGPNDERQFSLGGSKGLHGYSRDFVQGDFYYLMSAEYLRPIFWDGLRLAVTLEAGNAYDEFDHIDGNFYSSLGLGVRVRFPQLVNFEFEFGYAIPLTGGGGGRMYGDRIGK